MFSFYNEYIVRVNEKKNKFNFHAYFNFMKLS